jgi:orotate phosphoribosyltransferase
MNESEILAEFEAAEAILKGHFILSSGRRSDTYLQCARVLMEPARATKLVSALVEKLKAQVDIDQIDRVAAPAMGGLMVGYEVARQLNKPYIFCERVEGEFVLRRGFDIPEGGKVLVVEDVVTTGLSSREAFKCFEEAGGEVFAEVALVDRSNGKVDLGVPFISLLAMEVVSYAPDELPESLTKIPAIKPGSRKS